MTLQINNESYRSALYALLLVIPTFAGVPVEAYLLFIFSVFILERKGLIDLWDKFKSAPFAKSNLVVWLVVLIVLFASINKVLNGHEIFGLRDYYAAFYLLPFLILSSRLAFRLEMFLYLVLFAAFESAVGLAEYLTGLRSFFLNLGEFNTIESYDLLYGSRVYGLSANSSIFGQKMLLAFLLIDYIRIGRKWEWLLRILLLIGLIVSFSRTPILVLLVYWLVTFTVGMFKSKSPLSVPGLFFKGLVLVFVLVFFNAVKHQLTRGDREAEDTLEMHEGMSSTRTLDNTNAKILKQGEVDPREQGIGEKIMLSAKGVQSSGRKLIWINYLNFIEKHPFEGNGSDKLMFYTYVEKTGRFKFIHAHNSYLQLIGTHGLLIACLYFIFYLVYSKWKNWLAIGAILMYSALNFGIFYGFSYMDAVLLMFLSFPLNRSYENAKEG